MLLAFRLLGLTIGVGAAIKTVEWMADATDVLVGALLLSGGHAS